ncbi:Sua5/YciO/YrdC/YwlC family tRNA threonylcarbamoyl adenosine modification protein [Cryptococcus amylolentus CBS 6039]|uniref:Threonylcarbamoyl-AMP synthase n=2 Tax=Cryptococcus amylolentus TaxID=104669 RepID=A0A1E3I471_9TREE|nr:Sua5/YciO/YrdC/YwlC family tRNA threonylcarbamoyl adenosine modification protein [Cryptococcus amylolentus CBS 6039]ODN83338.1 Sua5/YciO/YrdC/YwlC family tRNA threonylcarbamoyl adenosine modification protein [Cryptococcus amylolentus CBS 6039]
MITAAQRLPTFNYTLRRIATMSSTPILQCQDWASIRITPSSSSQHPLDSPQFFIPPSILPHLEQASKHLHASQTVAVPTETVYGLAASSLDPEACQRIYKIKNRPSDNPLIIHVSSLDMLRRVLPPGYVFSPLYLALLSAFWPGPLSLLFPSFAPPPPPAPQTNAIRMPSHPLALALIAHSNLPLSAPSANSSGRPSPTRAEHVFNDLNGAQGLGCIIDGGDCGVGVESTVVNGLEWKQGGGGRVDILRPGGLGVEEIQRIVDQVDGQEGKTEILVHGKPWRKATLPEPPKSVLPLGTLADKIVLPPSTPGMKYRHYSPRVPVFLVKPSNTFPRPSGVSTETPSHPLFVLQQIAQRISPKGAKKRVGILHFEDSLFITQLLSLPRDVELIPVSLGPSAATAAQRLFAGMLTLESVPSPSSASDEKGGVDAIIIEGCSDEGLGLAVMERVGKAVGGGGVLGDVAKDDGKVVGSGNTFWVDVGET